MRKTFLLLALAVTAGTVPMHAQGWIDPVDGLERPTGVVRTRSHVQVRVEGRIATVTVEEWFHNLGARIAEGDYLYPLPGEAVFSNVSLFQGDLELTGETMDAQRARAIYEEIVRRKRDPALIELVGHGLIRARIFPIEAGTTRKVTLRFTQILDRSGDALRFQYAAGIRNRNVTSRADSQLPPRTTRHPISFELVASNAGQFGTPFSPTHDLETQRRNDQLVVRHAEVSGNLTVFLPLARELVGITVATHRPNSGEPGFFMMTLTPARVDASAVPRDITVAIDVSGSMSGAKLVQAKAALRQLIQSLNPGDRIRLIAFSNSVRAHRNDWLDATPNALADAESWVDRLAADGGTNISGALDEALRLGSPENRLPVVLFLTDGLPSVGEQNPDRIAQTASANRGRARIFTFGIGYDVNTQLLEQLSAEGRGSTEYVEPGASVERALGTLANKIQHAVLTDLAVSRSPVTLTEVYPVNLPDLFAGEELVVFGRYQGESEGGELSLNGRRGGRLERLATTAAFPDHELANDYMPRLWAARKLGFLTRTLRLEGSTEERLREIRETALRYGLLSEYTSYLVQEPDLVTQGPVGDPALRRDRRMQPSGQRNMGAGRGAAAATAATGQLAVESAKRAGAERVVVNESELESLFADADASDRGRQQVAGRTFELRNGVWTDLMHQNATPVTNIKPFSQAYFALLGQAPELEPWVSRFVSLLLAGEDRSILLSEDGVTRMTHDEVAHLIRDFRGH